MKIGLDLDDVLLDFNNALCQFHNTRYGTAYSRNDVRYYALGKVWLCSDQEATERVGAFYDSPEHATTPPVPGAVIGIKKLCEHHDLYIITSKPERMRPLTEKWLCTHFPRVFKELVFTNYFLEGSVNKQSKVEACSRLGITAFVDDCLDHTSQLAAANIKTLLLDCPWNQGNLPHPAIKRVYSWKDVVSTLIP